MLCVTIHCLFVEKETYSFYILKMVEVYDILELFNNGYFSFVGK